MTLQGKTAAVFAATGAVSSGVARAFATAGATVWLSAHDAARLEPLAAQLRAAGAEVHIDVVDVTDPGAIDRHLDRVVDTAGHLDIVFNGIGGRPADLGYPRPLADQSFGDFMLPLTRIAGSQYLTSRAAGLRMGPGAAIVLLSATLSGMAATHMQGISAACGAIEALTRSLAGELGPRDVRVNCVRASAMPETRTIQETAAAQAVISAAPPEFGVPPLGRPITVAETAAAVTFLASDAASGITGQVLTVCAGQFV